MAALQNIMVAVDLDEKGLNLESLYALEQARGMAVEGQTRLSLVHVLDVSQNAEQQMKSTEDSASRQYFEKLQETLEHLKSRLCAEGFETEIRLAFGKTWLVLIREVLKLKPDLLVAGAARRRPIMEALFGSTTMKLLRKCPCPVWVTKPGESEGASAVLVAHDLKEVGSTALSWGVRTARAYKAKLHVLHALELPDYDSFLGEPPHSLLAKEGKVAEERIREELQSFELSEPPEVSVVYGQPQLVIHRHLQEHPTDFLIMGTVGRKGLRGIITGNTAETLLPWVRCSLIALKPEGFLSPVELI